MEKRHLSEYLKTVPEHGRIKAMIGECVFDIEDVSIGANSATAICDSLNFRDKEKQIVELEKSLEMEQTKRDQLEKFRDRFFDAMETPSSGGGFGALQSLYDDWKAYDN